jgi:glycosidase
MENVVRFWLTVGVDGFRLDAIKHLIEQDGKQENTPATHEWLKTFYLFYKRIEPDAYTVGEVYDAGGTLIKAYGSGQDQMDHIFNFELASGYVNSANGQANSGVVSAMKFTLTDAADGNYAAFLTNHDQERVMSELHGDVNKAKVAASLLLTGPGTPYLYYGEEIGMTGQKPDELIRTPMQWSAEKNAGFTTGKPWQAINADFPTVNVAAQENDPISLLNHYRALIALRRSHSSLRTGEVVLLQTGNASVYAILRMNGEETLLVLVNLSKGKISAYKLDLPDSLLPNGKLTPQTLFGEGQATPLTISGGKFSGYVPLVELAPYATYVFRLK